MSLAMHKPLAICMALALAAGLSACGGGGGVSLPPPPPTPLVDTTRFLPNGVAGRPYSQTLQATGGTPPYVWSSQPCPFPLPLAFTFSPSGVLSSPSPPAGDYLLCVTVTDSRGQISGNNYEFTIASILQIPFTNLGPTNVGLSAMIILTASGGNSPYQWKVVGGNLPARLTLDPRGEITGVPTQPGTATFTLEVDDSSTPPQTAQGTVMLQITNFLVVSSNQLVMGVLTRFYSQRIQTAGGTPPYSWTATQPLPPGLSLDSTSGIVSGTPTMAGSYSVALQITDSSTPSQSIFPNITIGIQPVLSVATTTLPDAPQNRGYFSGISIVGGLEPYSLALTSGSLPVGLQINQTSGIFNFVQISGAPTVVGTSQFTVAVSDSEAPPMTATQTLSIRVNPLLQLNSPTQLPVGLQGQPYGVQFAATGGLPPLTWSVGFIQLPPGISLDPSSGLLSGTPTVAFSGFGSFQVTDSSSPPQTSFIDLQLTIAEILRIATTSLPPVSLNAPLQINVASAGGIGPFTWSLSSGSLQPGLSFNPAAAAIQGTPTATGTFPITLHVNDPGPPAQMASATLSLIVSSSIGRNDTIATATPLSNGTYLASISPASDPSSTGPDVDIYQLTADPGAVVSVETFAQRLNPPSSLDTVIDIVDATGTQLNTCGTSFSPGFQLGSLCVNNDNPAANTTDSVLFFQAPSSATGPVTFYVRVYDFKGSARPDYIYQLTLSGAK